MTGTRVAEVRENGVVVLQRQREAEAEAEVRQKQPEPDRGSLLTSSCSAGAATAVVQFFSPSLSCFSSSFARHGLSRRDSKKT